MSISFSSIFALAALMVSVSGQSCTQDSQCASPQLCRSYVCSCPDEMQAYQNGVCVSVAGAACLNNRNCVAGATCVSNKCSCKENMTEQVDTGLCFSPAEGDCDSKSNCAGGLDCINGKCGCTSGKIYNSDFVTYTYEIYYPFTRYTITSTTTGACQWALGMTCAEKDAHSSCITNYCDQTSNRCKCMTSAVPDETKTKCKCTGASSYDAKQNFCIPFVNAVLDPDTNIYKCAIVTKFNAAAKSCDCPAETYYDSVSNECLCDGASKAIDPKTKKCVCVGASYSSKYGDCTAYTNSDQDMNPFTCPTGTTQNNEKKSCVRNRNRY